MRRRVVALVVAGMAGACSGATWLPTSPTAVSGTASAATPPSARGATLVRAEEWTLVLTVYGVLGTDCQDPALHERRSFPLAVEIYDDGSLTLSYEPSPSTRDRWTGWINEAGVEGTGTAFEGLPCSGAPSEPQGAPSTLTGAFGPDGRCFTATEVRRYMGRESGEVLYYLRWEATQMGDRR